MVFRSRILQALVIVACVAMSTSSSHAVLLYRSATRNTTAPTGDLANSGWQWEGKFSNFVGTPIAFGNPTGTSFFLTALHLGGGGSLELNGIQYPIDMTWGDSGPGYTSSPNSDLRIWKVQGVKSIPKYASLYDSDVNADGPVAGKRLVVYGRGTQRGAPIYGKYPSPSRDGDGSATTTHELKGWANGPEDHVLSWGTNYVTGEFDFDDNQGLQMYYDFDRQSDLPDEGILSNGDSGGGVFIQSGGVWKLAAVNHTVDGAWKVDADAPSFIGPIFDYGGMYAQTSETGYTYFSDTVADRPADSYSTDVSPQLPWIHSVIDPYFARVPEPTSALALSGLASLALIRKRRRV